MASEENLQKIKSTEEFHGLLYECGIRQPISTINKDNLKEILSQMVLYITTYRVKVYKYI
jgi:hypothetical protein